MAEPINPRGGSLRPAQRRSGPGPEDKTSIKAIVDGDPELKQLIEGGPKPIDLLIERDSPDVEPAVSMAPSDAPPPASEEKAEEPFPWDENAPKPEPPEPPATNPTNGSSEKAGTDVAPSVKEEPYHCAFYWKNDPQTFSAQALIFGRVSDVAVLFGEIRVRYKSLSLAERMSIDDHMPKIQEGERSNEQLRDEKALIRLAMSVTHIQDRPLGESVSERMNWLRKLPEELIQAMHEAALEYQIRIALRLRGIQEQLKN